MKKVLIIGNGMMGGSLGMALTKTGKYIVNFCEVGIEFDNILIQNNKEHGIYLPFYTTAYKTYKQYDFVINCTGLKNLIDEINVIDISSVQYNKTNKSHIFCHPLCGSEKNGRENAKADLFENQNCIITTEGKSKELIKLATSIFKDIGMNVYYCDTVEEHNKNLARTSHLLYYLALNGCAEYHPVLKRLSRSNKKIWNTIFKANKKNIEDAKMELARCFVKKNEISYAFKEFVKKIPKHFYGTALKELI